MGKIGTVGYDNLVKTVGIDKGVTLTSGTYYTQGMLVVSLDGVNFAHTDILLSTDADYNKQEVLVLVADYDATSSAITGVGYTGEFNENNITFSGTQTKVSLAGVLQAKNITISKWSK